MERTRKIRFAHHAARHAFTLVELLVVIAIVGLLSTVAVVSLGSVRSKARDTKRLADMKQIITALELYHDIKDAYPANTDNDCGGWDVGYFGGLGSGDTFIQPLKDEELINTPGDPLYGECASGYPRGYFYYRYDAGSNGCDIARGAFYVLGVADMETSGNPHPANPSLICAGFNWNTVFNVDWVTGGFEN